MQTNRRESGKAATGQVVEKLVERKYSVEKIGTNLSVKSPTGKDFTIKVTSLSRPNAWIISDSKNQNSYYILVFKPEGELPDFFVLTCDEMRKEKQRHLSTRKKPTSEYSNPELEKKGLGFNQPDRYGYKNKWDSLPK